jgi:hypothetical protein
MLTMIAHIFHTQRGKPTQSLLYFQVSITGMELHTMRSTFPRH